MFEIEIFPLHDTEQRKKQNGICPETRDKNKRQKGHAVAPVVYPAYITAFVLHEPLKGTKNRNTELVHKDKKDDYFINPYIGQHADVTPHRHNKDQQDPVKTGSEGTAVGSFLHYFKLFLPPVSILTGIQKVFPEYLPGRHFYIIFRYHSFYEDDNGKQPENVIDLQGGYYGMGKPEGKNIRTENSE